MRETLARLEIEYTDADLFDLLRDLASDKTITLGVRQRPSSFSSYLAENGRVWWLYVVLLVAVFESFLVVYESPHPLLVGLRAILGLALLGFLPGYALTRATFPDVEFPILERVVLSIFLSVMVSIGIGTLLGAFFLFESVANVLLLSTASVFLAFVGSYRAFKRSSEPQSASDRKREDVLGPIPAQS